jgi:hypothetical protein
MSEGGSEYIACLVEHLEGLKDELQTFMALHTEEELIRLRRRAEVAGQSELAGILSRELECRL